MRHTGETVELANGSHFANFLDAVSYIDLAVVVAVAVAGLDDMGTHCFFGEDLTLLGLLLLEIFLLCQLPGSDGRTARYTGCGSSQPAASQRNPGANCFSLNRSFCFHRRVADLSSTWVHWQ